MNLIDQKFAELKEQNNTALIPFISVGDPNIATTVDIIKTLEAAGADIIELGVPYSDPLADGPVIQRASERALQHNITLTDCINLGGTLRAEGVKIPLILFTYFNPIFQFGLRPFFDLVKSNDISGLIIPDLPIEEDGEVRELAQQYNIHLIPLVAPTSDERVIRITQHAKGFVYCVSSLGVTGERATFHTGIDEFLAVVKSASSVPIAIGFGISSREQVARFEGKCDGVIVGSAIVRTIENSLPLLADEATKQEGLKQIGDFVASLKG
ncbi:tryptophan synthase subunit alpha [Paenibacillus endoradicis]|uniref:tryptophan synthase subunit alpha n=1 Tax=Paenibacillus endoradicis TaxID=2972487 RepID=UPI002158E500|nr:tryptophan synthase subunit alpha [Paenibacillus endoradicis]MCR8660287.1 tryptophan synthase subunit alpha [Paenibacillus endoradicis]